MFKNKYNKLSKNNDFNYKKTIYNTNNKTINKNKSKDSNNNVKKRKRISNNTKQNEKKYKREKNDDGNSSSDSEYDYDYVPNEASSTDTDTDINSDSELDDSKSENTKIYYKKRPVRKCTLNKNYKESDIDEIQISEDNINSINNLEKEAENEYEKYLEELEDEMEDNTDKKINKNNEKNEEDNTDKKINKNNEKNEEDNKDKKETFGHIIILSQNSSINDNKKGGYNLRKPVEQEVLSIEQKKQIDDTEKALFELNRHKIPPRNKILLSEISLSSKSKIIESMDRLNTMNSYSSEYSKLTRWLDNILKVPFGNFYEIPVTLSSPNKEITNYLNNIETTMDKCIYGQRTAKEKILEFVGKWITNPKSTNEPLAFIGEKGTGKTTLAKEGISKALGRPFYMISLGGESDAASFKGHDYTYEGSRWGRIVDILISTQCMNPVIFFDELDKISSTKAGEEIEGMLMHLTDTTQNDKFSDKYFSGIDFDLSKALFIFSYNDPYKLNPILRDRLTEINFTSFKKNDKMIIAKDFLIKNSCKNIGLNHNDYIFPDETILTLIEKYTSNEESGVRSLKRVIETLFLRINLYQLPQNLNISYKNLKIKKNEGKLKIEKRIVSELLKDIQPKISQEIFSMYT
jgi:ATP-dependent Lon protease